MNRSNRLSGQLAGGDGNDIRLGMVGQEAQKLSTSIARTTHNSYIYHKKEQELLI